MKKLKENSLVILMWVGLLGMVIYKKGIENAGLIAFAFSLVAILILLPRKAFYDYKKDKKKLIFALLLVIISLVAAAIGYFILPTESFKYVIGVSLTFHIVIPLFTYFIK